MIFHANFFEAPKASVRYATIKVRTPHMVGMNNKATVQASA